MSAVRTVVEDRELKHREAEAVLLAGRLIGWPVLVLSVLGMGLGAAFVAVQLIAFGVYEGASFGPQPQGHAPRPPGHEDRLPLPAGAHLPHPRGGRWLDVAMGGLNLQVEHHLFPSMPSSNLRRAQPIVREHCAAHGVPYTEAGLLESYGIVVRHLNRVGLGVRDPSPAPSSWATGREGSPRDTRLPRARSGPPRG